jgi:hypothetical protein
MAQREAQWRRQFEADHPDYSREQVAQITAKVRSAGRLLGRGRK